MSSSSTLVENFLLFSFIGIWRPINWKNGWKKNFYNLYSFLTIFLCYWFTLTEILVIIFVKNNISDFINTTFLLFTMIAVCSKMTNIIIKRKAIKKVIKCLNIGPFKTQNNKEKYIKNKYKKISR